MRLGSSGGDNRRRSPIASAVRSVNLYPEMNGLQPGERPDTLYPRPGLAMYATPYAGICGPGRVNGYYLASDGTEFYVVENRLLMRGGKSDQGWKLVIRGVVYTDTTLYSPVDFSRNGAVPFTDDYMLGPAEVDFVSFAENGQMVVIAGLAKGLCFIDLLAPYDAPGLDDHGRPDSTKRSLWMHLIVPLGVGLTAATGNNALGFPIMVDYIDTYFVVLCQQLYGQQFRQTFADMGGGVIQIRYEYAYRPPSFFSSLSNSIIFPALYNATTSGDPFPLQAIKVHQRHLFLLGVYRTEIWFNAGDALFPFAELPYVYVEYGCVFPATVATHGEQLLFWGRDREGADYVIRIVQNQATVVSSWTVANAMVAFNNRNINVGLVANQPGGTYYDPTAYPAPRAYCYSQGNHSFYVLTFGDETWAMDLATGQWHQRGWTDPATGQLHRERINVHGMNGANNVVGDWVNGTLYWMVNDLSADLADPVVKIRGFDPITTLANSMGQVVDVGGQLVQFSRFVADIEAGLADGQTVVMRYSTDRGRTWSSDLPMAMGPSGSWLTQPMWRLNAVGRDVRFELQWTGPGALNGAFVEATLVQGS